MRAALIRADASTHLGLGHVMRGITMAEGLEARGCRASFLTKPFEPWVTGVIRGRGFEVRELPAAESAEDDARRTVRAGEEAQARLLITDLCADDARPDWLEAYHRVVHERFFVLAFAGAVVRRMDAHLIVHPYVQRPDAVAPDLNGSRLLQGEAYALFRREFLEAARRPKMIAPEARRVLISIGGGDECHLTAKALEALVLLPRQALEARVVIGPGYAPSLRQEVDAALLRLGGAAEKLESPASLAEPMAWADLAVIGDGLTKYEAALTGTPSVTLSGSPAQAAMGTLFAAAGSTVHLAGALAMSAAEIAAEVGALLADAGRRREMSRRGQALVDGKGLERILAAVPAEVLA
jgi:spore coat polysaccharide biosynthesis predicted glycosyltransferase SpsG